MMGFIGMVIGVPLFAILYVLFKAYVENRLRKRGLPTETSEYSTEDERFRV